MNKEKIKVLIVDDHPLIIEGLSSLLEEEQNISLQGFANDSQEAFQFIDQNSVDVVLMDINMPGESGIEATSKIKEKYPGIKVVALSMHNDIATITRMLEAGADAYILKRTKMHEVIEAIKVVCEDKRYLGRITQEIIINNLSNPVKTQISKKDMIMKLSARESEVLRLISQEYSNEQIAKKLLISERTVEAHRKNIFIKTNTKTIVGLIKYAIHNGLIDDEVSEKP